MLKRRHSPLDLLDLPILVIDDILWFVYLGTPLIDWLNLGVVCSTFSREIDNLLILRHTFYQHEWRTGVRPQSRSIPFRMRMPASLYAFYLSQKILRTPAAASSCFAQVTVHAASILVQHEQNQGGEEGQHQIVIGNFHNTHGRYEKYIYLLCKAFATSTSNHYCCSPLEDHSWGLSTLSSSCLNFAVVTAAAYLGWHKVLADSANECDMDIPVTVNFYGDILSTACRSGCMDTVRMLLGRGHVPKPEFLTEAAREGHLDVVKLLAHYKNHSNVLKTHDIAQVESAIHAALGESHEDIVDFLLPAIRKKRHTQFFRPKFLAIAARKGCLHSIKQAVSLGWDLNFNSSYCVSVLGHACRAGRIDSVALLLDLGAKPSGCPEPMKQAAAGGHIACMQQLVDAGVDNNRHAGHFLIEPCARGKVAAVNFLFNNGYDISKASTDFVELATLWATFNGYVSILKILAEHGLSRESVSQAFCLGNECGRNLYHVTSALEALGSECEC